MSSPSITNDITNDIINNFAIILNVIIQIELVAGTMTEDEANFLRRVLIIIQDDPEYLNVISGFIQGFNASCASSTAGVSSTADSSSTITTVERTERVNRVTTAFNDVIQCGLVNKTMSDDHANILRDVLIQIRTDNVLLDIIIRFCKSFQVSCASSNADPSSNADASSTANANVINNGTSTDDTNLTS